MPACPQLSVFCRGDADDAFEGLARGDHVIVYEPVLSRIVAVGGGAGGGERRYPEIVAPSGGFRRAPRRRLDGQVRCRSG